MMHLQEGLKNLCVKESSDDNSLLLSAYKMWKARQNVLYAILLECFPQQGHVLSICETILALLASLDPIDFSPGRVHL